jgi:hypothetical protein
LAQAQLCWNKSYPDDKELAKLKKLFWVTELEFDLLQFLVKRCPDEAFNWTRAMEFITWALKTRSGSLAKKIVWTFTVRDVYTSSKVNSAVSFETKLNDPIIQSNVASATLLILLGREEIQLDQFKQLGWIPRSHGTRKTTNKAAEAQEM